MLFIGCETAGENNQGLPHAAVAAGATYAIGFSESIGCSVANGWTQYFFEYLAQNETIEEAALKAAKKYDDENAIHSYVIVSSNS